MRAAHMPSLYRWNDYNRKHKIFPVVILNLVEICKWITRPDILRYDCLLFYNN